MMEYLIGVPIRKCLYQLKTMKDKIHTCSYICAQNEPKKLKIRTFVVEMT